MMANEMDKLEIGDVISLDDDNGEELGEFEVIATFDLKGTMYVALTEAFDEEEGAEDEEMEIDIFMFKVEDGQLVPLEEQEEAEAHAKLGEVLEDIELVEPTAE